MADLFQNIGKYLFEPKPWSKAAQRQAGTKAQGQQIQTNELNLLAQQIEMAGGLNSPAGIRLRNEWLQEKAPDLWKQLGPELAKPATQIQTEALGKAGLGGAFGGVGTTPAGQGMIPVGMTQTPGKLPSVRYEAETTPQQKLQTATGLRKEFNAAKVYTNFQTIERSERSMKQAYEASIDPNIESKVASDQALAVLFQKMLDPTSVVRESEYARTPEGVALVNRIMAYIPQLQKGGLAITDADRKALYDMAKKLLEEAKVTMNAHIDRYTQIAKDYKVEPAKVLGNIKKFDLQKPETTTYKTRTGVKTRELADPLGIR